MTLTLILTPRSRVLLEKLIGSQLVKKFPAFYGNWMFITAFTSARHLSLSSARSILCMPPHLASWKSILILSSHLRLGLLSGLFSLRCPHQSPLYASSLPHTRYMPCPSHSRFYHPNNIGWLQIIKPLLRSYQSISPGPRFSVWTFHDKILFYGEWLSALRPSPRLEDYPLSAVRDCLFFIFAATLHIGGRSSFRNLRTGINATELNFSVYFVCPARRFLATCIKCESTS